MKRRSMLAVAVISAVGATALSQTLVAQSRPATEPLMTTQPVSASVYQLIKQLGSDDDAERGLAQQELVNRDSAAVEALKNAANNDPDPEVRSRAAAALGQITEHDNLDASSITLHLKDVGGQDALSAIAGQARAQLVGIAPDILPGGATSKTVRLDADQKPFWDVMTEVCRQLDLCPMLDIPTSNTLRLIQTPRNWFLDSPHLITGPYWIGVAGIYRMRTIDLMGPESVDDQFSMRCIVFAEPKLAVTQISEFTLKEAIDDAGNSLMPLPTAFGPRPGGGGGGGGFRFRRNNNRQLPRTVEFRLAYPEHPGRKISLLQGSIAVTLAEGVQQFVVDDVLGTAKQINPVAHCQIRITVAHNGPELFVVTAECTRDGMLDEQWLAVVNRVNDITLEDADGHALTPLSFSTVGTVTSSTFKSTALFSRNIFGGQLLNRQVTGRAGDARRLTWKIATRLKSVTVPVTFKDLPMP